MPDATLPTACSARAVLITGGARRLGAALCEVFAQAHWHVWCHYRHSADAAHALQARLRQQGGRIDLVQADLAHEAQRERMMAHIAAQHGPLQALINNASLFEGDSGLDFAQALAQQQFAVNVLAPLDLARRMAQQHGSDAPAACCVALHVLDQKVYNLNSDYFSYTVSKLALERAVALQALSLAPRVRVCGVAPGLLYESGSQSAANFAAARCANALRRATDPLDVARACLFLAQNPAITGSTLCVDGGQHLLPLPRDIVFVVDELLRAHIAPAP